MAPGWLPEKPSAYGRVLAPPCPSGAALGSGIAYCLLPIAYKAPIPNGSYYFVLEHGDTP